MRVRVRVVFVCMRARPYSGIGCRMLQLHDAHSTAEYRVCMRKISSCWLLVPLRLGPQNFAIPCRTEPCSVILVEEHPKEENQIHWRQNGREMSEGALARTRREDHNSPSSVITGGGHVQSASN